MLNCASCCTCPSPQFAFVHRAASKSKAACGLFNSADGNYYRTHAVTTISTGQGAGGSVCETETNSINSTLTTSYDPATCAVSNVYSGTWTSNAGPDSSGDFCSSSATQNPDGSWTGEKVTSTGNVPFTGYPDCYQSNPSIACTYSGTNSSSASWSDEYTTAQVQSAAIAALPAFGPFPPFSGGVPGELASSELSADGSSYSIMESKYQFAHPLPPGGVYKLTWVERFTPDGGGSYTDTAKDYTWDGTRPSGYNPNDATTWPKTAIFEVDHPGDNGVISLHELAVDCGAGPTTLFS